MPFLILYMYHELSSLIWILFTHVVWDNSGVYKLMELNLNVKVNW